jgi:hypothetical protein
VYLEKLKMAKRDYRDRGPDEQARIAKVWMMEEMTGLLNTFNERWIAESV